MVNSEIRSNHKSCTGTDWSKNVRSWGRGDGEDRFMGFGDFENRERNARDSVCGFWGAFGLGVAERAKSTRKRSALRCGHSDTDRIRRDHRPCRYTQRNNIIHYTQSTIYGSVHIQVYAVYVCICTYNPRCVYICGERTLLCVVCDCVFFAVCTKYMHNIYIIVCKTSKYARTPRDARVSSVCVSVLVCTDIWV